MITKLDGRKVRVWFFNHKYDYKTELNYKKSCYQLMITITISEKKNFFWENILDRDIDFFPIL